MDRLERKIDTKGDALSLNLLVVIAMSSHQVLILIFNVLNFCVLTNLIILSVENSKLSVNALQLNNPSYKKIPTSNHYGVGLQFSQHL